MRKLTFDKFDTWVHRRVPERFKSGTLPYLYLLVWLMVAVMVVLSIVTPYPGGLPSPLIFAAVLITLLHRFERGMPLNTALAWGLTAGLLQVGYTAWLSGGIFSPRMAWVLVIPLVPFYAIRRKAGAQWFGLVLLFDLVLTGITWQGWLPENPTVGRRQAWSSYTTHMAAGLILIVILFIYHNWFSRAYRENLTQHQQLQNKRVALLKTSAQRERFVAAMNYALRTPMHAILGFNQLLLARADANSQAEEILTYTQRSADHLLTVINDVLDYSELQVGQLKISPEICDLHEVVHTAFDMFVPRASSMCLHYSCQIHPTVPRRIYTDRHRLVQILVNLLGNAIKFTHQGAVTLRVSATTEEVRFEVQDTGVGIASENQARMFQRFSQVDDHVQSRYGGNGLGLSITKQLVELMDGQIAFTSTLGEGSQFWFTLPLRMGNSSADTAAESIELTSPPEGYRFLVVDDHAIQRLLLRQILQNHWPQAQVLEAENGMQALEFLQAQAVDLVLMDLIMPLLDGLVATRILRQSFAGSHAHMPVLGLTANVTPSDLAQFKRAGVDAIAIKPFQANKVCAQIEQLLRARRSSLGS